MAIMAEMKELSRNSSRQSVKKTAINMPCQLVTRYSTIVQRVTITLACQALHEVQKVPYPQIYVSVPQLGNYIRNKILHNFHPASQCFCQHSGYTLWRSLVQNWTFRLSILLKYFVHPRSVGCNLRSLIQLDLVDPVR